MEDGAREELQHLQSLAEDDDFHVGDAPDFPNMMNVDDILTGAEQADLSHTGGELGSLEDDIEEDLVEEDNRQGSKREDWRTRRDHTEIWNWVFLSQMPEMVLAYICMCAEPEMPARPCSEEDEVEEMYEIQVVDMFDLHRRGQAGFPGERSSAGVDLGANDTVRPVEADRGHQDSCPGRAYHVIHIRCPQLAIQVPYHPYLCQQFSITYNLYLDLRRRTDERVMRALGCDSTWRLKHACPACTYKLEGEDALIFDVLSTMDGNDSLKRVLRRVKVTMAEDKMGEPVLGKSREQVDNRDAGDTYYIWRERVEKWVKDRVANRLPMQMASTDKPNPCADRWKNMINDVTSKMWGIFDETGIFLALCHHRFVLVIADMIKSRELVKYPLAVVKELLDTFGMKLGVGYDIGCHFKATVANSKLGDEAHEKKLKCLVGSFHNHTHNRLCQLRFLATYVEGMGLEDLEGCERLFSHSNGLAKSCCFETYANLSKFLCANYRQALEILKTEGALQTWMQQEKVDSTDRFHEWLVEEKAYLEGLKDATKTNEETLAMEYMQKLVNLSASQAKYQVVVAEARRARADDTEYTPGVSGKDRVRCHAQEKMEKDLDRVQELEETLGIVERWTTESPKWTATVEDIKRCKYNIVLNALELLIVERIFELTKMNQSQTGLLHPPMPSLTWEQVVEYAFLADFDILRDTCAEVQSKPWARPAYRLAMDRYFKILRAREEIKCLNIEIRRVVTWIRDENTFLRRMEKNLRATDGKGEEQAEEDRQMAVQVRLYRLHRRRFDAGHLERFQKLAQMPGFTGMLQCGVVMEHLEVRRCLRQLHAELGAEDGEGEWVDEVLERQELEERLHELCAQVAAEGGEEEMDVDDEEEGGAGEDGEGHEAWEEAVLGLLHQISMLAMDNRLPGDGADD
ncbi:hypothetical protein DFH08DRAFT_823603 [Mycena albidolilacea]|uniref:CxC2-like cysteine cluster KDZ transposase-associated domain-containing protein n=1 Tax=Mycena albidolilacea TaxID=1033008 RepID=A0AAD6Z688_9AGAR|nr:hypothetical protein DFH08DRAFT_823603 [Mycena albidolilacea]